MLVRVLMKETMAAIATTYTIIGIIARGFITPRYKVSAMQSSWVLVGLLAPLTSVVISLLYPFREHLIRFAYLNQR
jgi:hypothetical protein